MLPLHLPQSALVLFQMGVVGGGLWTAREGEGVVASEDEDDALDGDGVERMPDGAAS